LFSETLCFLTLEAEAGDKVTIWCEHDPTVANYIFWFKHTSDSVPLRLGCKQFLKKSPAKNCYFFTESERIMMSVYDKNTSLTITAVNVSDTALYYCSYSEEIIFSNSTSLHVKGKSINTSEDTATVSLQGCNSPAVFFMLSVVFGALTVILLSVLIFIKLKHRKTHTGAEAEDNKVADSDTVHYAAIHFTKKKSKKHKRSDDIVDPHVVYSSVGQSN
ncbi:putative immune-type receptor 12a precursor, partial [Clarias magur]